MILAKFEPNRTIGSKVMDKKLIFAKKKKFLEPFWNRANYPVPGYPEFCNYPVLITRFLTSLIPCNQMFEMFKDTALFTIDGVNYLRIKEWVSS